MFISTAFRVGGAALLAVFALASPALASPIFSCPSPADCNGNLYAVSAVNTTGNTWQLTVDIQVTNGYTGNQFTDLVDAISINGFASSYSNFSLLSDPGGTWDYIPGGLDANGCNGNGAFECVQADTLASAAPLGAAGNVLEWVFQFDTTSLSDTTHLKYLYVDTNGTKIGSLGSFDIDTQTGGGGGGTLGGPTPEPITFALVGGALVALGLLRRHATA